MDKVDLRSAARGLLFCAIASLAACAASDEAASAPARDDDAPAILRQQSIRPDPNSTYFVEVVTNGSGCPAGSANTRISSDGLVFTTTFSKYEARVNSGIDFDVRECQLAIRLHTPAGISFSVQSFSYTGYSFLEEGVRGRQSASYYFQGVPVATPAARTELIGPHDADYLYRDDVELEDAVWSPCGVERDLNINTRIVLENPQLRSGFMNLTAVDGQSLIVTLAARQCDAAGNRTDVPVLPTQAGAAPPTDPQPAGRTVDIGQTRVLPLDDYANGGLLLAQQTSLRERGTLESLSFYVTSAVGKLRLGLYDASGPGGRPGRKLAESAELTPVVGWNKAPVARVALSPGSYWLAYLPSSNDLHFRRGGEQTGLNVWYPYAFGPLPETFSEFPTVSNDHWSFYATLGL